MTGVSVCDQKHEFASYGVRFLGPLEYTYMHAHHLIGIYHAFNVVLLHSKTVTKLMAEMQDLLLGFVM